VFVDPTIIKIDTKWAISLFKTWQVTFLHNGKLMSLRWNLRLLMTTFMYSRGPYCELPPLYTCEFTFSTLRFRFKPPSMSLTQCHTSPCLLLVFAFPSRFFPSSVLHSVFYVYVFLYLFDLSEFVEQFFCLPFLDIELKKRAGDPYSDL
jgi:hypothetical protein